jgi:large subunit ribosomal protein L21
MYAIVKTGGKQYRVEQGQWLLVERLPADDGAKIALEPLLYVDGENVVDGDDISKVKVEAKVLGHERGPKLRIVKFKPKRGYKRRTGHRQELTRLEVTGIKLAARRSRAAAEKPAAGEAKAAEGKAGASEAKGAAGAKPATGRRKAEAAAKPATGRGKAEAGGAADRPAVRARKPAEKEKPAAAEAKPAEAEKPAAPAAKAAEGDTPAAEAAPKRPRARKAPDTPKESNDGS